MMMHFLTQYKGLRRENYILFVGRVMTNLGAMIWPVLTMILTQKLGMTASQVAVLMVIAGLVQMPMNLLGGKLADQYNKKHIIVICDLISIVFYVISSAIPLSYVTIFLMLLAATCQSMENPAYNTLIADLTLTKDREKAYSLTYLGSNLGLVASPTIAGLLFANYLWLSFLISAIAIGISTALIFFFIKDITPMEEEESSYQQTQQNVSILQVLRENKVVVGYLCIMALYWGAYHQYGYLMPLDMARVHGDKGAVLYGTVSSLNCIVVVIFTPILTRLLTGVHYTVKNAVSVILLSAGYLIFVTGLGHIPIYYMAITLFTWGEILATIVNGPYLTERIPASHRGRINGIMSVFQAVLGNVVLLITGMLYDQISNLAAWTLIFLILGIALAGSLVLIVSDRKEYPELYL